MDDWETFDHDSDPRVPYVKWDHRERKDIDPDIVRRVLFVLVLCEKRMLPKPEAIRLNDEEVLIIWMEPSYRCITVTGSEDEHVELVCPWDGTIKQVSMIQMETTLMWQFEKELRMDKLKNQFSVLFDGRETCT